MRNDTVLANVFAVIIAILLTLVTILLVGRKIDRAQLIKKNAMYYHPQTGELMIRECKE